MNSIINEINRLADNDYALFTSRLIPTVAPCKILGLRSKYAREIAKKYAHTSCGESFMSSLPHNFHDEEMVHAYMLGYLKEDGDSLKKRVSELLPHINSWASCDSLCASVKRLYKNRDDMRPFIESCLKSDHIYTVRFGLVSLLDYYVEAQYIGWISELIFQVRSDEYYINMALAWLVCECLVREYELSLPLLKSGRLCRFVQNKSIQKSKESYRLSREQKDYLYELRSN